jgi:hypothetical protein
MKAILEFELPEDQDELNLLLSSRTMASAIFDVDNRMRSELKYGITFSSIEEVCEWIREALTEAQESIY